MSECVPFLGSLSLCASFSPLSLFENRSLRQSLSLSLSPCACVRACVHASARACAPVRLYHCTTHVQFVTGDTLNKCSVTIYCYSILRHAADPSSHPTVTLLALSVPREQRNEVTSFLDASVVYGSAEDQTVALRTFRQGMVFHSAAVSPVYAGRH